MLFGISSMSLKGRTGMTETHGAITEVFSHVFESWEPVNPTKVVDVLRPFGVDLDLAKANLPPEGLVFHTP